MAQSGELMSTLAEIKSYLPWVSFVAGLGGSLHCVGMCGGLVTATCEKSNDVIRYQAGRLLGYLILGAVAGWLGTLLEVRRVHPVLSLLPALSLGVLFIFWGLQNFKGKRAELPVPRLLSALYKGLWNKLVKQNRGLSKAFFTGAISIFLPCGLLYGVVLGTVALQHRHEALFSMFFFWLGTLPSMVIAPKLIQRLIRPLKSRLPKAYALSLMMIGVLTIGMRMVNVHQAESVDLKDPAQKMSCH